MHPQVNVFLYPNYMYSFIDIPELFDQVLAFLIISLYMVDGYFFQEICQPFVKPVKAVLAWPYLHVSSNEYFCKTICL